MPRIFFPLISAWDLSFSAPISHDFLYRCGGRPPTGSCYPSSRVFTRKECDRVFLKLMEDEEVWAWRRWLSYLALRWFGYFAFKRGKEDDTTEEKPS